jgi:hypothetical protein
MFCVQIHFKNVVAIFMQGKQYCSWKRQKDMKFVYDPKIEFKKSFELSQQISLKVSTKAGINFCSFCMDQIERNEAKG